MCNLIIFCWKRSALPQMSLFHLDAGWPSCKTDLTPTGIEKQHLVNRPCKRDKTASYKQFMLQLPQKLYECNIVSFAFRKPEKAEAEAAKIMQIIFFLEPFVCPFCLHTAEGGKAITYNFMFSHNKQFGVFEQSGGVLNGKFRICLKNWIRIISSQEKFTNSL